ncbi:hypothetical protein [Herbiconiux liangxiaofengii]|uniref:hypothetical protein n=1 Tax=Herbiconiux liangxiaofengii TaxID=3342795 RepID=UPI0035B99E5E
MPKTLEPNTVLDGFLRNTRASMERYIALYEALEWDKKTLALRRGLTSDVAFRLGSEWEIFQHQWFVAAIHKKQGKFRSNLEKRLHDGLSKAGTGSILEIMRPGSTEMLERLSASQIEQLVDPEGYNVSFKDNVTWIKKADLDLDPSYCTLIRSIASTPSDACIIDLVKGLRNAIAHGSGGSLVKLNSLVRVRQEGEDLGISGDVNKLLVRDTKAVKDISAYLHRYLETKGVRRVVLLHQRIEEIAERLRIA